MATIYADPPWAYSNKATRAAAAGKYPTMSIRSICDLCVAGKPVVDLVSNQAYLYLWTTTSFLFEAPRVMEAWGFEYKNLIVWSKTQPGLGNYFRVNTEFLLVATRGGAKLKTDAISQKARLKNCVETGRLRHSQKPEVFRGLIERTTPGPYLELFARVRAPGWYSWGNQVTETLASITEQ